MSLSWNDGHFVRLVVLLCCLCLHQNCKEVNKHFFVEKNPAALMQNVYLAVFCWPQTWRSATFLCSVWKCDVWVALRFETLKRRNGVNDGTHGTSGRRLAADSTSNYCFCSESRHKGINTWRLRSFFFFFFYLTHLNLLISASQSPSPHLLCLPVVVFFFCCSLFRFPFM